MLWGQGGQYSDEFTVTLDTPQALAAGDFLHDLFHGSKVAGVGTDAGADFAAGIFASTIGSTGSLTGLLDAATFEVGTAYLPDGPNGSGTPTGGTGLAIPASRTPEQQLAAAMFLAFLTDAGTTRHTFSQATGYMPVRTSAVEGDDDEADLRADAAVPHGRRPARRQVALAGRRPRLRTGRRPILTDGDRADRAQGHADAADGVRPITPRLETAYQENVEPYL